MRLTAKLLSVLLLAAATGDNAVYSPSGFSASRLWRSLRNPTYSGNRPTPPLESDYTNIM